MDEPKVDTCTMCDAACSRLCSRCKSARYCSDDCQKADWPLHKLLCADFAAIDLSARPSSDHVLAMRFEEHEMKPSFFWLKCYWMRHDDDPAEDYQLPDWDILVAEMRSGTPMTLVSPYDPLLKSELPSTICLVHRESFLGDGSKVNKSIRSITCTQRGKRHEWRGPILAYSHVDPDDSDLPINKDIDMSDFRQVADLLLRHEYTPATKPDLSRDSKIKGVRVNCVGDVKMFGRPFLEAVVVPATDPIFVLQDASNISKLIGLPICKRNCQTDQKWAHDQSNEFSQGQGPFYNPYATLLYSLHDKAAGYARTVAPGLNATFEKELSITHPGSVILVRQDFEPLQLLDVMGLLSYCETEIYPLLLKVANQSHAEKESVITMINRHNFVTFWKEFVSKQRALGESIPDNYSPFNI